MRVRTAIARLLTLLPLLAPVLAAGDADAQARCSVQIRDLGRIEPQDDYDPFASAPEPEYHRFEVAHLDGPSCQVAVTVSLGENGDRVMERSGGQLDYELFRDASLSTPLADPDGSPSGWMVATIPEDESVDFEFFSVIPVGQIVPSGRYTDRVRFEVYLLEGGLPGRRLTNRQIQVRAEVLETVQTHVSIDGTSRPLTGGTLGTVDFGALETGASRAFQLTVQGNTDYRVTIESENEGRLDGGGGSIPYSLAIDGQAVGLGSGATLNYTNARARTHALVVSVGDIGRALAGTYTDNLYLTVTAR